MSKEKGSLSINSENIMPIIKKWLYSDSDIFIRELVSNAADAITKHQRLVNLGEADAGIAYRIEVSLDKENKKITITDNGIGMTAEEIKKYINQIAFSGANDFVEKYKNDGEGNDIIGHFGLGFYSAFMVAKSVEINSLSYQPDAEAVKWVSDGTTEYELFESDKVTRGTQVTLSINEDSKDFLDSFKLKGILEKYCGFLPVEIFFTDENKEAKEDDEPEKPVNDTYPLWLKKPTDCTDDEYKEFYHKVFMDFNDPLFWIHLNIDYPFRLKGILFFPKLKHELESIEGQVKLFNNQVFIAENIKEVIPDFLLLLKGAIDCPDLPLNVSRSFLQNDGFVTKMSGYITRKVADKLNSVFGEDRELYNKNWDDINQFIKYGCIRDKEFYDRVKGSLIYKTLNYEYLTAEEYLEKNKDKQEGKVFYATDEQQQSQYIKLFKSENIEAVLMTTKLDNPFMSYVENYEQDFKFTRIDADLSDALKEGEANEAESKAYEELFKQAFPDKTVKLRAEALKNDEVSAVMLLSEESRRMKEMSSMFGPGFDASMFKDEETLVLNTNNSLIKLLHSLKDDDAKKEDVKLVCEQVYDLAMLSHKPLSVEEMTAFVNRSNKLLEKLL